MKTSVIVAVILSTLSMPVHAGPFVELGQTTFAMPPDKLYHQEGGGFPTNAKLKGNFSRVGWEQNISTHFSGRVSVFGLGKTDIRATTGNEPCFDAYGAEAYALCPKEYQEEYHTQERVNGGALTLVVHTDLKKVLAFTFEFGPTYIEQSMWLDQSNWPDHAFIQSGKGRGYMLSPGVRISQHLTISYFFQSWNAKSNSAHSELFGITKATGVNVGYQF